MPERGPADPNLPDGVPPAIHLFPAPCGLLDSSGTVEAVNDEWRAAAASHQLLARPGDSFIDAVTARSGSRRAAEGIRDVVSGRSATFTIDIASGGADGARWFRLLASGRGSPGATVMLVDITDHHLTEEALRESEERFRQMVDSVQDYAIFTLDTAGRIVTWNRGADRITGYAAGDAIGGEFAMLFPPEDVRAGKPPSMLASAAASGRHEDEGWRQRKDGGRFWAHAVLTALRDASGALRGYSLVTRDLTERRRSEAALSESQTRLLSIIESAMDAIITVDGSQRVILFNKAAERAFGVPVTEAIGSPLERFIPERFRRVHSGYVRSFGNTGATTRAMGRLGTLSGLKSDGTEFPIEASISQAVANGQRFYTVILRDISERQKLEQQLLQSQKMEGIGRLAGGIAHDFNNLLMAMFGYLALAARRLEPDHAAQAHLAHAKEAADRAAALTRQLLAFARKQVANPRAISPRDVVSGLEPMLHRLIGEDIKLKVVLSPDTAQVRADPAQLEQVVMNLAVNARDAMPKGGTLTIETGNLELDAAYCNSRIGATPGPHVMIAVTDTGSGMTPQVMSRLFEPFFTTKPPGKGTGLGLATCHGIIKQSGGHIAVYSEPNRGTSIKVFLPRLEDATRAAATPRAEAPPVGGSETILFVEDSRMVQDLVAQALREGGYNVLTASSGPEGLSIAASASPPIELLITDVVMPEMSGVELSKALEATRPGLGVIYISGYTEETIVHHGVADGRTAFLAKPFTVEALLRKVREVLDGSAPDQP